ncbi:MAG: tRNA (adenosine(37)-N6)-dimethylallyltransferase MiaA [Parcubacteria group bacterium]|jgi:tRNA dimethylallyltransferase
MPKRITIIGPTASGKSAIAIALAKQFSGEIISADSRQIHRNLTIGTGKEPGHLTLYTDFSGCKKSVYLSNGIRHHMIDIVHPNTPYNAGKFVRKAMRIQKDIQQRKKLPIICGGTLFWAQALIENAVFPSVLPNPPLRTSLQKSTCTQLLATLRSLDPIYAQKIDPNNPVRLIRAIEIATALGSVPQEKRIPIDPQSDLILAIMHPRDILNARIEKRMDTWFDTGIFDEIIHAHHTLHVPWSRLESFGLEYKWCTRYVRGQVSFDLMRDNTIRDLKHYAKRQETWIRRWEKQNAPIRRITKEKEAHTFAKKFLYTP